MKIKDATGVASIQEVVERFLSQGATRQHLESLKEDNTQQIARLKEERVSVSLLTYLLSRIYCNSLYILVLKLCINTYVRT